MLIHCYDHLTGQYISSKLADPDPKREGEWLQPAFCTVATLPDRKPSTWPYFVDGSWVLRPDYRGKLLYRQDNGEPTEILSPGVTPADAGLTAQPRPSADHHWLNGEWAENSESVARRKQAEINAEFELRLTRARLKNAGKADAYAAGLLSDLEKNAFKAWAHYQLELVRAFSASASNPDWPLDPDLAQLHASSKVEQTATFVPPSSGRSSDTSDPVGREI